MSLMSKVINLNLDTGQEYSRQRESFWQLWLPKHPPPPPKKLEDAELIPLANANFFSKLAYSWITPIMVLGYQRTLQAGDLWKLDHSRETAYLSTKLDDAWARRALDAATYNAKLDLGEIKPSIVKRALWTLKALSSRGSGGYKERRNELEERWKKIDGRKEPSLAWALNDTFGISFWLGGFFKVFGDTTQLMGPLLVKAIINFSKTRAAMKADGKTPPQLGRGIGMAIGVFLTVVTTSVCQHQFFWRSMATGVLARGALIASIYKRGVNFNSKSRMGISQSALVNHISTDVSRINTAAQWFHASWTAPIQVIICLIILLVNLGPSCLAGFALFLLIAPLQHHIMSTQFKIRKKSMIWTDKRAKVLLEVMGGMRVVKYFGYEEPFLKKIYDVRREEVKGIKKVQNAFSISIAFALSVPALAATLAFVAYTSTTPGFDVAVIFSSLSLFQLLRQPLMFLPRALSAIPDARNALQRLEKVFHAELMSREPFEVDREGEWAVCVQEAVFEWESVRKGGNNKGKKDEKEKEEVEKDRKPFQVRLKEFKVERGSLVAIVGPVGSGKSSLLQGLIGEMKRISGDVTFGGRVSYCAQTAWIQNATLRNNVLFGQPFDEDRYWKAIENASLLPDLQALPDGDLTEIGEKGINLSGGQKQRVNIARALYFNAEIVILDDPLSAVDAHVGRQLFQNAILKAMKDCGVTVILVTHALHFLSQVDYIFTMNNGMIGEHGTYQQLVANGSDFARLDKEFGGVNDEEVAEDHMAEEMHEKSAVDKEKMYAKSEHVKQERHGAGTGKKEGYLIVKERRTTGSVSWKIYWAYVVAGRGALTGPLVAASVFLMQGSQIINSYILVWWEANAFNRPNSFYQILYACLGISQAIFTFLLGIAMDYMSFFVSQTLHHDSVRNILYSPMSFFDTTPIGRILGVLQKDIDTIDNQLAIAMRMSMLTFSIVAGSVLLICVLEPYFLIVAVFVAIVYTNISSFYRSSAREIKRLDSMLRSVLFAHFAESLTGLPTIRSYGVLSRFIEQNRFLVDLQNRALLLTVTNQRWLAIRLDFMGAIMVLVVALLAVVDVRNINPAQIGLVLTYTTQLAQMCGGLTRQSADVENNMNSVERVLSYAREDQVSQEAPHEIADTKPPKEWPQNGSITFSDITMSYRPGLPNVLNGISIHVKGGEKIGVVGRTGAGKSSLMLALFRIVELNSGSITIDGVDISTIGLRDLRSQISMIPQDPLLFSGTIRSNLDPFSSYDDAHLWSSLQRSYLVKTPSASDDPDKSLGSNFTLESPIEAEGANLSVGERSLLSLARALVKDSKVVVMDEATASVDLETDGKIQRTIQSEFQKCTVLCIAHRLRTIISYDRILVLDAGTVSEFDTPETLFNNEEGIFRSMCERSNISLDDIRRSRESQSWEL